MAVESLASIKQLLDYSRLPRCCAYDKEEDAGAVLQVVKQGFQVSGWRRRCPDKVI